MTISKELREAFENKFYDIGVAGYLVGTEDISLDNGESILSFLAEREEKVREELREKIETLREEYPSNVFHPHHEANVRDHEVHENTLDEVLALLPQTLVEKK